MYICPSTTHEAKKEHSYLYLNDFGQGLNSKLYEDEDNSKILTDHNVKPDYALVADGMKDKKMNHTNYMFFLYGDGHVQGSIGDGEKVLDQNDYHGLDQTTVIPAIKSLID